MLTIIVWILRIKRWFFQPKHKVQETTQYNRQKEYVTETQFVPKAQLWDRFVYDVEAGQFRHTLTPEDRKWIISHRDYGWEQIHSQIPFYVMMQFDKYESENSY